jgi:hypothetical protein
MLAMTWKKKRPDAVPVSICLFDWAVASDSYETSLPVVQLGGLTAIKVDALAMDLSKLSSTVGRPIGGVLGYSLFKTRITQMDYPNRKVRFYKNAPLVPELYSPTLQNAGQYVFCTKTTFWRMVYR